MSNNYGFYKYLNERGLDYEEACANFLQDHGFDVTFDREHSLFEPDITIAPGIEIDVKGSRLRKLNHGKLGYGFLLHKVGHSGAIHEPIVALVCYDHKRDFYHFFFVPTAKLRNRHYLAFRDRNPLARAKELGRYYQSFEALAALGAVQTERIEA